MNDQTAPTTTATGSTWLKRFKMTLVGAAFAATALMGGAAVVDSVLDDGGADVEMTEEAGFRSASGVRAMWATWS